jgi:hypothetical protein
MELSLAVIFNIVIDMNLGFEFEFKFKFELLGAGA